MNNICPQNNTVCLQNCASPCIAHEISPFAVSLPGVGKKEEWQGILATFGKISEMVKVESNFQDSIKISTSIKL